MARGFAHPALVWPIAACLAGVLPAGNPANSRLTAAELAAAHAAAHVAALDSIRKDDLQQVVGVLADDAFEGREAGSRGGHAAAGYIVERLQKLNLAGAAGGGSYRQPFGNGCHNLIATLPGRDPQLEQEIILISAHYDHVGYGSQRNSFGPFGYVHNGADDNASGVAALLEVADALALSGYPMRRTICLAFWDGEEQGLLGSKHWTQQPTLPLDRIKLMINLDMVGRLRDDRVEVYGTRSWAGSRALVARANAATSLLLDYRWEHKDNSDHDSFFQHSIPYLMYHTGLHENYHRPSDDVERLNYSGMERVSELVWNTLVEIDQQSELAPFRPESRQETEHDRTRWQMAGSAPAPRLGIQWDPQSISPAQPGLKITFVAPGSPADRAGLHVGDRLMTCNNQPIESADEFQRQVFAAQNLQLGIQPRSAAAQASRSPVSSVATADTVAPAGSSAVQPASAAEPLGPWREMNVALQGGPQKLGISWREIPGEASSVVLVQVAAGSPAARAGLRIGDRLVRLGPHVSLQATELTRLAPQLELPVEAEIERDGRLQTVQLSQ
ncbi:MAG: M20/M25/M40 family metallo-hydrolase [Pirellulales bacterium]